MNKDKEKFKREIDLEGSFNFRDLGGYETEEGYTVKRGKLFRSGNLSGLTKNDLEIVNKLGIKKICDLRAVDEIEGYPDPNLDGTTWLHTPIVSDPMIVRQVGDLDDTEPKLGKPGEMLVSLNKKMVTYTKSFRQVFKVLVDEPQAPLLFHCMAGKDRTGAVAALILSLLGVPRETILEDYLYTNQSLEQMKANFEEIGLSAHQQHIDQAVLDAMLEARMDYLHAFFDELERRYGNIDTYLKEAIGLTDEDIKVLKSHLLE